MTNPVNKLYFSRSKSNEGKPKEFCLDAFYIKLKSALSVSWYSYNRSQLVQYVKYTKWNSTRKGNAKPHRE